MADDRSPLTLRVDPSALAPLIRAVVTETIAQLDTDRQSLPPDRLCFDEAEAARLLGLEPHQLRDERRRGRISASQIVGRRIRYTREDLVSYLAGRRVEAQE